MVLFIVFSTHSYFLFGCCLQEEGNVQSATNCPAFPAPKGCSMSGLVGTGHKVWSGLYIISSTLGLIILMALLEIFYINPYGITKWWYKGLLLIGCMTVSILVFGGAVVGLWHLWETRVSEREGYDDTIEVDTTKYNETLTRKDSLGVPTNSTHIKYGTRPDFNGMFHCHIFFFCFCNFYGIYRQSWHICT